MTQEEKDLLLKDLCGRLPYGVKIQVSYYDNGTVKFKNHTLDCHNLELFILDGKYKTHGRICQYPDFEFKPYLRPISSMTDEEEEEYNVLNAYEVGMFPHTEEAFDWLNAHHFDYRGLIEKGLAIEAPEGMYNIK